MYDKSKGVNSGSAAGGCILFCATVQGSAPTKAYVILTIIKAQLAYTSTSAELATEAYVIVTPFVQPEYT
jgi:hypothetical protein